MSDLLLETDGLSVSYGPVRALHPLNVSIAQGSITSIVGSNGAGKSTLLNCLAGLVPPDGGRVSFQDKDITRASAEHRARSGLVLVPEGRRVVSPLSVEENLLVAGESVAKSSRSDVQERMAWLYDMFPILRQRRVQTSGQLSGGEQQLLALARALMLRPSVLMLDEPSMGLAPIMISRVYEAIGIVREAEPELGVLLVEQSGALAATLGGRLHVLRLGTLESDVDPASFDSRKATMSVYLRATSAMDTE